MSLFQEKEMSLQWFGKRDDAVLFRKCLSELCLGLFRLFSELLALASGHRPPHLQSKRDISCLLTKEQEENLHLSFQWQNCSAIHIVSNAGSCYTQMQWSVYSQNDGIVGKTTSKSAVCGCLHHLEFETVTAVTQDLQNYAGKLWLCHYHFFFFNIFSSVLANKLFFSMQLNVTLCLVQQ